MAGLYVQLDTNWPDNPKVIAAGLDGAGLHAAALCIAKRLMTDGVVWRTQLRRVGGTDDLIDFLVELGLLEHVDDARVRVAGWLDRNPSRLAIGGRVGARKADGKRGNHKRWNHPGDVSDCPRCNPTNEQVVATGDRPPIANGLATRSPRLARDRDRDIENRDRTAADRRRALDGNAQVRALAQTPPDPDLNAAGTTAARAALHPHPPT